MELSKFLNSEIQENQLMFFDFHLSQEMYADKAINIRWSNYSYDHPILDFHQIRKDGEHNLHI